ncbi:MAG: type II toxin-antitoxin system VapC family toxin, partial [Novosphingobium sp.]
MAAMIYCDTSFLIPSLVPEPASQAVRLWLAAQEAGTVCISPWVATEFSSAIAIKLRHGALDGD